MAASVWIRSFSTPLRSWIDRPVELTTPVVSVPSSPKGLPIARTFWPTCTESESPSLRNGIGLSGRIWIKARSFPGSVASTVAL